MTYSIDVAHLSKIIAALKRPARSGMSLATVRWCERIATSGWMFRADVEDLLLALDYRLDSHGAGDAQALVRVFELQWQSVAYRPKARSTDAVCFDALPAAAVAQLLIFLERCGFTTNPEPLVKTLLPAIRTKAVVTDAELSALWCAQSRHKSQAIKLAVLDTPAATHRVSTFTSGDYRVEGWAAAETDSPTKILVHAPKYRHRREPVETICPTCGYQYWRGSSDSSATHRKEHKTRMQYLDPQPHPAMLNARTNEVEPELVTTNSPAWKHREIYLRACAFRREFHYDFVQWGSPKGDRDPHVHGFLFSDEVGRIVGACAFRLRDPNAVAVGKWGLQWIWISPPYRRQGQLARRWPGLRARFGDFEIEAPVSPAMRAFADKQGDVGLL